MGSAGGAFSQSGHSYGYGYGGYGGYRAYGGSYRPYAPRETLQKKPAAGTAEAKNAEEAVSEPKRRGGVSPDLVDEE